MAPWRSRRKSASKHWLTPRMALRFAPGQPHRCKIWTGWKMFAKCSRPMTLVGALGMYIIWYTWLSACPLLALVKLAVTTKVNSMSKREYVKNSNLRRNCTVSLYVMRHMANSFCARVVGCSLSTSIIATHAPRAKNDSIVDSDLLRRWTTWRV